MPKTKEKEKQTSAGNVMISILLLALIALPIALVYLPDEGDGGGDGGGGGGGSVSPTPSPTQSPSPSTEPLDPVQQKRRNTVIIYTFLSVTAFGISALAWIAGITQFGLNYSLALDAVIFGPGFGTMCVVCAAILINSSTLFWLAFGAHLLTGLIANMLSGIYAVVAYMVLSIVPIVLISTFENPRPFNITNDASIQPGFGYYALPLVLLVLDGAVLALVYFRITEKALRHRGARDKESKLDDRLWLYKETIYSRYIETQTRLKWFSEKIGGSIVPYDEEFLIEEKNAKERV